MVLNICVLGHEKDRSDLDIRLYSVFILLQVIYYYLQTQFTANSSMTNASSLLSGLLYVIISYQDLCSVSQAAVGLCPSWEFECGDGILEVISGFLSYCVAG